VKILDLRITIPLPDWLYDSAVFVILLYRRLRFGHPFRRIPLTKGKFAIVDPPDYEILSKYKWRTCKAPNTFYAERSIRKQNGKFSRKLLHRHLMQPPANLVIDHINRNGLDNRRANLRLATISQNAANSKKRNPRSGYKGVWLDKQKNLYRAAIWSNNKRYYLGLFESPVDAAKAYDDAAKKLHKDFAALNFE